MSYPVGMSVVTCTLAPPLDFVGGGTLKVTATFELVTSKTNSVTWAATGQELGTLTKTIKDQTTGTIVFQTPAVDQAGWKDSSNHDYSNWAIRCTYQYSSSSAHGKKIVKLFQPKLADVAAGIQIGNIPSMNTAGQPIVGATAWHISDVFGLQAALDAAGGGGGGGDAQAIVDTAISNLINGAPTALNDINELAAALGDDANFAANIATSLAGKLNRASNLSDLNNIGTSRTNLGLGTAATHAHTDYDAAGAASTAAAAAQAAAIAASLQRASNLSDLANATTARTNLGLGTAATHAHGDYDAAGAAAAAQTAAIAAAAKADALRAFGFEKDHRAFRVSDIPVVADMNVTPSGAFNRTYTLGNADFPLTRVSGTEFNGAGFSFSATPYVYGMRKLRFMTDGDAVAFYVFGTAGEGWELKIDGQPTSLTPYIATVGGSANFVSFDFGSADTRMIELTTSAGFYQVYVKKPYKAWKVPTTAKAKVLVVGDSYTAPMVFEGAATSFSLVSQYGIYQGMAPLLGLDTVMVNGIGGTGYIATAGYWTYGQRLLGTGGSPYNLAADLTPDVVIIHGGGANDLNGGSTQAQVITAATALFTSLRAALPNAKLIFIEGFAPPAFTPSTYNPIYAAISSALRAALTAIGVYYVDVATTDPWIDGIGYMNHVSGDDNSNIYVGNDGAHLTVDGAQYVRDRMARPLRRILQDNGPLLNTLVS